MGSHTHTHGEGPPPLEEDDPQCIINALLCLCLTPLCSWPYKRTGQVRIARGYRLKSTAVGYLTLLYVPKRWPMADVLPPQWGGACSCVVPRHAS